MSGTLDWARREVEIACRKEKPFKVYCEDFLTDKKNGDFDTVGVFYALKTENGIQEKNRI